jgi:ABC-2 type transport system permease protein
MTTSIEPHTPTVAQTTPASLPIPFSTLVGVEWTKATDTRAARWLLGLVALSTLGIMLVPIIVPTTFEQTHASYLEAASIGQVVLLPVVALLMLTGEWSQRSIMTTFTQEPRRIRVVNAKLGVALMLGGASAVLGGVVTAVGIGVASAAGRTLDADLSVGVIVGYVVYLLLNVLGGVAFGALVQSSATAIAAYFSLNAGVALLASASTLVADWVDTSIIWLWVLHNDWEGHVAQIAVSVLVWIAAPIGFGVLRTLRRDVG